MNSLIRALAVLLLFNLNGIAQSYSIATVVGPPLPVNGASAITQNITHPNSVCGDRAGGFYFSSSDNRIYHVTANGALFIVAGTGAYGFGGDGGPAVAASFAFPGGIALDAAGNLYIADSYNNRIRKVTPAGTISTVAGGGSGGDGDAATSARLDFPRGVAVDFAGNLLISNPSRILKVSTAGTITTIAGSIAAGFGGDGGPAVLARLGFVEGIAVDASGNIFIADAANNRVRKITPDGTIDTVAGSGGRGFSGDGGPALSAQLSAWSVVVDSGGNLFVADIDNNRIRKISNGVITTVAGGGPLFPYPLNFSGDGGPATSASLSLPLGIALDDDGNLLIADSTNDRVRKVSGGIINTVAGYTAVPSGDGGPASATQLRFPTGVAIDGAGNLYVADRDDNRIRKVTTAGIITIIAGNGTPGFSGDGGPATSARLQSPYDLAIDSGGNLFVADSFNNRVRKVTPAGTISTIAGSGVLGSSGDGGPAISAQLANPRGVAVDAAGNLFIADSNNHRIRKVTPAGIISTVAGSGVAGFSGDGGPSLSAQLNLPSSVAIDGAGNLFVAEYNGFRIRKINPNGIISTAAGSATFGFSEGTGGPATSARLAELEGIAVDEAGYLFFADLGASRIDKVTPFGVFSSIAGVGPQGFSGDGGPASAAQLVWPAGIALDGGRNVFFSDALNHRVRKLTPLSQTSATLAIPDRSVSSLQSMGTASMPLSSGYASIQPAGGSTAASGLAIFGFRQNGVLVTEATVPASPLIQSGRIYAEIRSPVNTGVAIANPNSQPASISFFFADQNGDFGQGTTTIPPNGKLAAFLDESPFNGRSLLSGSFTFNSSVPVAVIALRGLTNERGEFLITTLPVADLRAAAIQQPIVFPHFADGGGWTTQIVLVNRSDSVLTGTVQFRKASGETASVTVEGQAGNSFAYSIPPRASRKLETSGGGSSASVGSVRVTPDAGTAAPSGLVIFSFRSRGVTVTEAGVPALDTGAAFRLYAEAAGDFNNGEPGSVQTGFAVTNASANTTAVVLELQDSITGSRRTGVLSVPANGQAAVFLNQIDGLSSAAPLQGLLRVSSSASISVVGLRGHYNERNDFLITTIPPVNENAPATPSALFFPHVVDAGGYSTQFILFSSQPGQSSTALRFFSNSGKELPLILR